MAISTASALIGHFAFRLPINPLFIGLSVSLLTVCAGIAGVGRAGRAGNARDPADLNSGRFVITNDQPRAG